jgi:hypothetical protein
MNQLTTAQQLRTSVKLIKPELLADVPKDYDARQTFNFLRHRATNYDTLIDAHAAKYGPLTAAEKKALTQGAADVVIAALRAENEDLIQGKSNTIFARFARRIRQVLSVDDGVDLEAIYEATKTLKRSQIMFKSWNERYRRQKKLVLTLVARESPELFEQVEAIYKANSDAKLLQFEKANDG